MLGKAAILGFSVLFMLDTAKRAEPPQRLPLIHADYPACVTINPGQLQPKTSTADPYPRRRDVA